MKLRTRMALTFVLIIAIPLLLTVLSFMAIRTVIGDSDDPIWSLQNYSVQDITMKADDIYNDLLRQKYKDSAWRWVKLNIMPASF